jgi:phage FluMu gp28-like protein
MLNKTLNKDVKVESGPAKAAAHLLDGEVKLRPYQWPILHDHKSGIVVLHWARQIGKSYALAAWAVLRLLRRKGRLVTVLSNSRENGAEFLLKCSEICRLCGTQFETKDASCSPGFDDMRMELRIHFKQKTSRIKVLAANPRTARGFSGDLILDEFAFHEDSAAIWAAAEPILASNKDFLCRIASTGNGRHNMFFRMVDGAPSFSIKKENTEPPTSNASATDLQPQRKSPLLLPKGPHNAERSSLMGQLTCGGLGKPLGRDEGEEPVCNPDAKDHPLNRPAGTFSPSGGEGNDIAPANVFPLSASGFRVSKMTRTEAHKLGTPVYDLQTRQPITPEQARAQALDKRAYDQNFECAFGDESLTLLTHELISAAEQDDVGIICEQDWNSDALDLLRSCGRLYAGFDVGRKHDLSVITVLEQAGNVFKVRAILRMSDMRLPEQELRLGELCRLQQFQRVAIDLTGLGLGLFEYAQKTFGRSRIQGINFASTVPITTTIRSDGGKRETVRVTEAMAMELLRVYEDRRIRHPRDERLREDLRKPEKITSPGGRVSIAATRDEAGHADHFWSFALAIEATSKGQVPCGYRRLEWTSPRDRAWNNRRLLI